MNSNLFCNPNGEALKLLSTFQIHVIQNPTKNLGAVYMRTLQPCKPGQVWSRGIVMKNIIYIVSYKISRENTYRSSGNENNRKNKESCTVKG